MVRAGPATVSEWARREATAPSADDRCFTGRRLFQWRRGRSVDAKVGVHVEHSGARAAWKTRVARMARRRRSTPPWLAGVEAGLCVASGDGDRSHATAHGRGGETAAYGRWRDGATVLSKRVVFSPIREKRLMQTQAGECGDGGSAARQFRVATDRGWRSAENVRFGWR